MTQLFISAFITLFVVIDPPGCAPIYAGLTKGATPAQRRNMAIRACFIAAIILLIFALFGEDLLGALHIELDSFRIAGGLMLFAIAFEMIFEKRNERKEKTTGDAITKDHIHNLAVFPLAIPLIAGPGAIATIILLTGQADDARGFGAVLGVMMIVIGMVFAMFMAAGLLEKMLGKTGINVVTRLLGMLLAALSVQFILDGLEGFGLAG